MPVVFLNSRFNGFSVSPSMFSYLLQDTFLDFKSMGEKLAEEIVEYIDCYCLQPTLHSPFSWQHYSTDSFDNAPTFSFNKTSLIYLPLSKRAPLGHNVLGQWPGKHGHVGDSETEEV